MKQFQRTIVTVLFAPIGIVLFLLVFGVLALIAIPVLIVAQVEHRAWLRKLRNSERLLTPAEIAERGGSGTLIVDQPGWDGQAKYCWWTPDDVGLISPIEITPLVDRVESLQAKINQDDLPLDRWIYNKYLKLDTGTAYLVTTKLGDLVASRLHDGMPNLKRIETWSAPIAEFGSCKTRPIEQAPV
jgi:hypothetical protein